MTDFNLIGAETPHANDLKNGKDGSSPQIVIFDLGEVLVTPTGLNDALAMRLSCDPVAFRAAYWRRRLEYDLGLETLAYWTDVLERLGISATASMIEDLTNIDTDGWTTIRPDAAAHLEKLYSAGVRIGILSNATIEMAVASRQADWARWVTDWFFSAELGLVKPQPEIYRHVTAAIRIPASSILYVDDSERSVQVAISAGWNARLWTSNADTSALVAKLIPAPSSDLAMRFLT